MLSEAISLICTVKKNSNLKVAGNAVSRELGLRDVFNDKAGVARTTNFWPATNAGLRVRAQTKETTQPKVHLDTSEDHHGGEQLNYQLKLEANCHSLLKATPTKSVTLSNLESKET